MIILILANDRIKKTNPAIMVLQLICNAQNEMPDKT